MAVPCSGPSPAVSLQPKEPAPFQPGLFFIGHLSRSSRGSWAVWAGGVPHTLRQPGAAFGVPEQPGGGPFPSRNLHKRC